MRVLELLERADHAVIDLETTGLDWKHESICGYSFYVGEEAFYVPVRHGSGGNIPDPEGFERKLSDLLKSHKDLHIINHNIPFDLRFMTGAGLWFSFPRHLTFEDTMINEALIYEEYDSISLDASARRRGVPPKSDDRLYVHLAQYFGGQPVRKVQMGNFWRANGQEPVVQEYAKGDAITTWHLWNEQQKLLDDNDLRLVQDVENRCIPALVEMTCRGIRIDEERLHEVDEEFKRLGEEYMGEFPEGINFRSNLQMQKFFTDKGIGKDKWALTPKGNPSFTKEWLATNEWGQKINTIREMQDAKSKFVDPYTDKHLKDGRVHPEYNHLRGEAFGTITGRLSSNNPNIQQVPKRNPVTAPLLRSTFLPDDGLVWGEGDFNQCEPRILAHFSGCKVLVEGYTRNPPIDAHQAVADAAGIDRYSGKRMNQGLITGMGMKAMIEGLGVSYEEGKRIWHDYHLAMPEIQQFQRDAERVMRNRGYIRSMLGRRSHNPVQSHGQ